jgi:hypothetical protein
VYGLFEKPQDTMANTFANHAHNDMLELWLETGLAGLVLMAMFASWFGLRAVKLWRKGPSAVSEIDSSLAQAATIIIGLIVVHSFVDYPLRTGAMMAIMALACALLLEPLVAPETRAAAKERAANNICEPLTPQRGLAAAAPEHLLEGPGAKGTLTETWGDGIDWPAEWTKPEAAPAELAHPARTRKPPGSAGQ